MNLLRLTAFIIGGKKVAKGGKNIYRTSLPKLCIYLNNPGNIKLSED